jgi:hypothetical protein
METERAVDYSAFAEVARQTAEQNFSWWKPAKPNDLVTGKVLSYAVDPSSKFQQKVIKLDTGGGAVVGKGASASLASEMDAQQVAIGDIVSLIYRGERVTKAGTNFKKYDLVVHQRSGNEPF